MCCKSRGGPLRHGPLWGAAALAALSVAFVSGSWLFTKEPVPLPQSGIATSITFRIGLWRVCPSVEKVNRTTNVPSPTCTLVKYSGWEDVGDLGIWTTLDFAPVFVSRMRFCTILCGTAMGLLLLANLFAVIGHCNSDNKTIIACGLFILGGLSLGTGLVIFASSLSETVLEISQYHRETPTGPVYSYRYGWCFFAAGVAFIMTNMAALVSIFGYLNRFASVDEMVCRMVPGAERKLLDHQQLSTEYLVRLAGPSSLQYDPLPVERPKYDADGGPLLNKTPPDVCTTNQCHDFGAEDLDRACVLAGIVETGYVATGYNVAQTLAGQTIPITIKNHNSTAPLSFSNVPMKYGTMQLECPATLQCTSALHQGFLGVTDLGSSSSTSSSGYCGRSKTLGYKNKKKCEKADAFQEPETSFADFGKRTTNELTFSGSAV